MGTETGPVREGTAIGPYVLIAKLGEGGFGEVWKARHREWEDRVDAFKFPAGGQSLEDLRAEGKVLRSLEHENIVRIHDIDTQNSPPYIRMEFVEGESLEEALDREGRLPLELALSIFERVLSALGYAHGRGVLHLDLKPANILLGSGGAVKLTDFGIAVLSPERAKALSVSLDDLEENVLPSVAGTLDYMSPEQKRGDAPGPRSDIYSLGVVLYRMLAGRLPRSLKPPSHFNPEVPEYLDRIVVRMMDPVEDRYASVDAVRAGLERKGSASPPEKAPGTSVMRKPTPAGEVLYALSVVGTAACLVNWRAFTSVFMWAVLVLCAGASVLTSRVARFPVLSAMFWGGLVFAFLGSRVHPGLLWGGVATALAGAIVYLVFNTARFAKKPPAPDGQEGES